jgi:hypothetical protein
MVDKNPVKKIIHEFFATSIDEQSNRLLSEDYHFCKIARKLVLKSTLHHGQSYLIAAHITSADSCQQHDALLRDASAVNHSRQAI